MSKTNVGNGYGRSAVVSAAKHNVGRIRTDPKVCHCEERSDAADSWYNVQIRTPYQEIATSGFALLAMTAFWKVFCGFAKRFPL